MRRGPQVVANLTGEGLASGAVYKEMFLSEGDLAGLHSEQRGLIDFLVLAHSTRFVGFGPSTYSFFLREYRTMQVRLPSLSAMGLELLHSSFNSSAFN